MKNNLEILNEWEKTISNYPKFKFTEAKELYQKIQNITDSNLKRTYMQKLIMGTLYVVANFIKSSGLLCLNSVSYDMNDIISVSNEIWINKINLGKLLEINSFGEMFDSDYYNKLCSGLGITKYPISINTILDVNTFIDLLTDYIDLKKKYTEFDHLKFLEFVKDSKKYDGIKFMIFYYGINSDICNFFDAIIKSFELEDEDINMSKNKLKKLKYILISNGLDYLRTNINDIVVEDIADSCVDVCCRKQVLDIVLNSHLDDSLKEILLKRFGISDGRCPTTEDFVKEDRVTRKIIRIKEERALRELRKPVYAEQLKQFI